MNYEKAYKEALERASKYYNTNTNKGYREIFEDIFPELKESEDERIRKGIICGMNALKEQHKETFASIPINDCIAWLEKQGEQKQGYDQKYIADIFEQAGLAKIARELANDNLTNALQYTMIKLSKKQGEKPVEQDTEIHDLWVYIREWNEKFGRLPKDEDELAACVDYVMKRQKPTDKVEPKFKVGDLIHNKWSNHSKEIVAVDDYQYTLNDGTPALPFKVDIKEQDNWELVEQKPAWSKEDEKKIMWLVRLISTAGFRELDNDKMPCSRSELLDWLKSLKDRFQLQPKQEWSEYDKIQLSEAIQMIEANGTWIRSEDAVKKVSNWLKSLKPHWKPSEEQMEALCNVAFEFGNSCLSPYSDNDKELVSLYNDLKKL